MKRTRLIALLLAAVLLVSLLSGCELPGKAGDRPKKTEAPAQTVPPTEPTEPAPKPRTADVGGVKIRIDESGYAPYAPKQEKYTRLADGPLEDFVPSLSYGTVFPYVAGRLYGSSEDGYVWQEGSSRTYGLADSQGRLLTDGVYTTVYPLYNYLSGGINARLPYLEVTRYPDVKVTHHDTEWGGWDELDGKSESALIAMDGSFMIPFGRHYFAGYPDCIIAFDQYLGEDPFETRPTDFIVYDLAGEVLFYSASLPINKRCDYVSVAESEGLLKVSQLWYESEEKNVTDYYDLTGKHVLGPYKNGSVFTDGLACVTTDGEVYGYIDKTGAWVLPPKYYFNDDFHDGRVLQKLSDGALVMIDTAGRELLHTYGQSIYDQDGLIQVSNGYDYAAQSSYNRYYDYDGTLLYEGYLSVERLSDTAFAIRERKNGSPQLRIEDRAHPEKNVTLPNIDTGVDSAAVCIDGRLVRGIFGGDMGKKKIYIVDAKTLEVMEYAYEDKFEQALNQFYAQTSNQDVVTGETWYLAREKGRWVLFDKDEHLIFRFVSDEIPTVMNGYICATDATACTVYDTAGNVVFRRRLDAED